jgi:phospholipid/cholesterol/gamma-HCH transport system substrate-binding protein
MKRDHATELRVGIFVMVALVIGGSLAFVIGNQANLFASKVEYHAVFDQVDGLRPGSPVRVAGVDVGSVRSVEIGEDGRIHVAVGVVADASHLVRVDSTASLGNKGLLGDKLLDISVGSGAELPAGGTLRTETPVGLGEYLTRAGGIITDVEATVENLRAATEPLGEESFATDLRETTHNLTVITRMAAAEDGALARVLQDPEAADSLTRSIRNVEQATSELRGTASSARRILNEVESGDGSAHELIYGPEGARLVTNLADATGEVATLMRDVREGDGMVHDIVYEDAGGELMTNVTAMSADLRAIVADVRAGRGTIGGLLVDPSIYEDVKRLVGNLERNEILRALVRYSIRRDEAQGQVEVGESEP